MHLHAGPGCSDSQSERVALAYVVDAMQEAGFMTNTAESSKYLMLAGLDLVNCIGSAERLS
jgi:hypothetical protein